MSDDRVAELEAMVRVLSAGLGFGEPMSEVPQSVRAHLVRGEDVKAIKALRTDGPGRVSLVQAKRMVDAVKRENIGPSR